MHKRTPRIGWGAAALPQLDQNLGAMAPSGFLLRFATDCIIMKYVAHLEFILINRAPWRCDFVLRNIVLGKLEATKFIDYICIEI